MLKVAQPLIFLQLPKAGGLGDSTFVLNNAKQLATIDHMAALFNGG
jgi:hypothetical protein